MNKIRLVKCPFCGNKDETKFRAQITYGDCDSAEIHRYYLKCWECRAAGPPVKFKEDAISQWNLRA